MELIRHVGERITVTVHLHFPVTICPRSWRSLRRIRLNEKQGTVVVAAAKEKFAAKVPAFSGLTWASALRNSLSEHETTLLDSINKSRIYLGLPIKRPKRGARAPCIVTNTGTSGNNGPRLHESALQRTPGKPHRVASDAMNETP